MASRTGTPKEILGEPLTLPCGVVLPNRFMKSATSENLGSPDNRPTPGIVRLYQRLASGGTGLIVTGNVMIDRNNLGEPHNVAVTDERDLALLTDWARAGTSAGNRLFVQLNHPGRQIPNILSKEPVAPSAVPFGRGMERFFNPPRALTEEEIVRTIGRFGEAARVARKAGFTGVQIHGAHGYLVSQFLSPHVNRRQDQWGGSLKNRMRFLTEIYKDIRAQVGDAFPISVKLNSADFQFGGFAEEDSIEVIRTLADMDADLLEISGGSYEAPAMTGRMSEKDAKREAYFLEFAQKAREAVPGIPLSLTGGFRTAKGMAEALASGFVDLVGLARPLVVDPDIPVKILSGQDYESPVRPIKTGFKPLDDAAMLEVSWYELQLARMAAGKEPRATENPWLGLAKVMARSGLQVFQRRRAK